MHGSYTRHLMDMAAVNRHNEAQHKAFAASRLANMAAAKAFLDAANTANAATPVNGDFAAVLEAVK